MSDERNSALARGTGSQQDAGEATSAEWAIFREIWHGHATAWTHTTAGYAKLQLDAAAQFGGNSSKTIEVRWLVPMPGTVSVTKGVRTESCGDPTILPPLPQPEIKVDSGMGSAKTGHHFTADQMREYGKACVEADRRSRAKGGHDDQKAPPCATP